MFSANFRFDENQTTIKFPCDEEYLSVRFNELGVADKLKTSQYMTGTDYTPLKRLITDFVDVDELNFLAKRLDSFDNNELNIFESVCEARLSRSVMDMINLTYNINNYTLVQDMSSMESIGRTHFKAVHIGWNPGEMDNVNLAKIRRELMNSGKSKMTEKGMLFEHEGARFINEYDGHTFPEYCYDCCKMSAVLERGGLKEYVYLPTQSLSIDKALKRLGTTNIAECSVDIKEIELDNLWFEKISDVASNENLYAANNVMWAVEKAERNNELDKLEAVIEFAGKHDSASIIKLQENMDNFRYYDNVYDAESLGRALIDENEDYRIHSDVADFFMFEQYAEAIMDNNDCKFCDNGAVLLEGATLDEILNEDNQSEEITMGGM